jgi:hypothetical protein
MNPLIPDNPLARRSSIYRAIVGRYRSINRTPTTPLCSNGRLGFIKICLPLLCLMAAPPTHAEELGRLFFTPAQRAQLDYDYAREAHPDSDNRRTLSVTGIVQKHGGARTIWINGVPKPAGKSDDRSPESAPVAIPGQSKQIRVKVGQKVYINPAAPEQ